MAQRIRKNDVVEVISGDHKGARGKVLKVDVRGGLIVVEGINLVFRHVRPTRRNPQGGRVQKEAPLPISKVLPYDTVAGKGRRVRFQLFETAGARGGHVKKRVTVSGTTLHTITRASPTES